MPIQHLVDLISRLLRECGEAVTVGLRWAAVRLPRRPADDIGDHPLDPERGHVEVDLGRSIALDHRPDRDAIEALLGAVGNPVAYLDPIAVRELQPAHFSRIYERDRQDFTS